MHQMRGRWFCFKTGFPFCSCSMLWILVNLHNYFLWNRGNSFVWSKMATKEEECEVKPNKKRGYGFIVKKRHFTMFTDDFFFIIFALLFLMCLYWLWVKMILTLTTHRLTLHCKIFEGCELFITDIYLFYGIFFLWEYWNNTFQAFYFLGEIGFILSTKIHHIMLSFAIYSWQFVV